MSPPLPGPLAVIAGPTAVGKTGAAVEVALRLGGEVITADSMQVYRGMDIGTAKPTLAERRGVPHCAIDVADPGEPFSVARYQSVADAAIAASLAAGRLPILAGGTGLYIRAVTEEILFPAEGADPALRERLERLAAQRGRPHVHALLAAVDPKSAARLHPNDLRRVIRAIEVYETTGQPLSEQVSGAASAARPLLQSGGAGFGALRPARYRAAFIGLTRPREELYARIDRRAGEQIAMGLVREVRGLLARGLDPDSPAAQGLGYKEIIAYVRGAYDLETAARLIQTRTRRYAKRQYTWFRRDPRLVWHDLSTFTDLSAAASHLTAELGAALAL